MLRLLYISNSRIATEDMASHMVNIRGQSKKNNPALGITGVLIHGGGVFMQVIEGPEHQVLRKYVSIMDDPRHTDCRIVLITMTEERAFPDWAMGVLAMDEIEFQVIQEMISYRKETVETKVFRDLIRLFVQRLQEK